MAVSCSLGRRPPARWAVAAATAIAFLAAPALPAAGHTDWDIYMLNLVNRARTDPAQENTIQGTNYSHDPASPVAYNLLLDDASWGHNNWMFLNLGNEDLIETAPPRSFAHFQTDDGQPGGNVLDESPGFTGAAPWDRVTAAGFDWSGVGENLIASWSSTPIPVDADRIEANHSGWWNSGGHRNNMMNATRRLFGHAAETRPVTPDTQNNFPEWAESLHLATQKYARALTGPHSYAFGLLYDDLDASGDWTPRDDNDPLREGLAAVSIELRDMAGGAVVAAGDTMASGAFTLQAHAGSYELVFYEPLVPGSAWSIAGVEIDSDWNTDAGTLAVPLPGDANHDGIVDGDDLAILLGNFGQSVVGSHLGDFTADRRVGLRDASMLLRHWSDSVGPTAVIPEPSTLALLAGGGLLMLRRGRSGRA